MSSSYLIAESTFKPFVQILLRQTDFFSISLASAPLNNVSSHAIYALSNSFCVLPISIGLYVVRLYVGAPRYLILVFFSILHR